MDQKNHVVFLSTDAKCKVPVGEPDYPIAAVRRGRSVIVGINEVLKVGDHDFTKLSIIPDAYLIHDIPHDTSQNAILANINDDTTDSNT